MANGSLTSDHCAFNNVPEDYKNFDRGASVNYLLDPHGLAAKML